MPAEAEPQREQPLTPHVAILDPHDDTGYLDFGRLDAAMLPIANSFLQFAVRRPLIRDKRRLWGAGRTYFRRTPINESDPNREIDVFAGFYHSVESLDDLGVFLAVDLTYKYTDRLFLLQRTHGQDLKQYRYRHCLYQFGNDWYRVQFWNATGTSISKQKFTDEKTGKVWTVYDYTCDKWGNAGLDFIRDLDPDSPAILYRYPGNQRDRYGAAALCRLLYLTDDPKVKGIHARSARHPDNRFDISERIVKEFFNDAYLGDTRIEVSSTPYRAPERHFPVPDQVFGNKTVLHVKRTRDEDGVSIHDLGVTRLAYLANKKIGPFTVSEFHAQYLFIPSSLPREVAEQFQKKFEQTAQEYSPHSYKLQPILYNDRQARSLAQQVKAFQQAVETNNIRSGYALLILPENSDKDLHNYLKRALWPHLQFQCANARKLKSYFTEVRTNGSSKYVLDPKRQGKFASYLRNTTLGLLIVNRKWPWALQDPLHYDAYVGIDVLNGTAGVSFIFANARECFFQDFPAKQTEKITRKQMITIIDETLRSHLKSLNIKPRSLVFHRDGRTFDSELAGIYEGIKRLKRDGLLPEDVIVGIVDIRKSSSFRLRIAEDRPNEPLDNPWIGDYFYANEHSREGFVCNTGRPFDIPGTVKPLHAVIVDGDLKIRYVLEDMFALSQLIYAAPDRCARLPVTIKLANDFLEPIASDADDDKALYGDDDEPGDEDQEEAESPNALENA